VAKTTHARILWMAGLSSALILIITGYLHWPQEAHAVPANNNFADAITITTPQESGIVATGDNTGATTEPAEPTNLPVTSECNNEVIPTFGATVWYNWTADFTGPVVFDTFGSSFDTVLGVYTGNSILSISITRCNRDFPAANNPSALTFNATSGTTYRIQVGGVASAQGEFVLSLTRGALLVVNSNSADSNFSDGGLVLREAMLLARAGTGATGLNRALSAPETSTTLNVAAAGAASSDMIRFNTAGFSPATPATITLAAVLPEMNASNDTVSGMGAGVIVNGNSVGLCFYLTSNNNRVEALAISNCGATAAVQLHGTGNTVGGDRTVQRNVIQGPGAVGVRIISGSGNAIYGNYISFSANGVSGTQMTRGVQIESSTNNIIGGPGGKGNLVIGLSYGIHIVSTSSGNVIQGNKIGTDAAGVQDLSSATSGILIDGTANLIGGPNPGEGNLLSGSLTGIQTTNTGNGNTIQGNLIGTDVSGTQTLWNALNGQDSHGLWMDSRDNIIGGVNPGEANIIAFNGGSGVHQSGSGNRNNLVRGNSIHSNVGAPVVIQATAQPPQNPVIGSVSGGIISGFVCASCTVDIYNDIAEEGRIYLGSTVANPDGTFAIQGLGHSLANITITATGSNNWTSRYSSPFAATPNSDGDGLPNGQDGCPLDPEDYDGFEDGDGCPDYDNDMDGICDAHFAPTAPGGAACTIPFLEAPRYNPSGFVGDLCPNQAEDLDDFKDLDGCPDVDNDGDTFPDHTDDCPGTDFTAGPDGIADTGDEPVLYLTPIQTKEDFDGVLDHDGCHDSPDDDYDGDGLGDEFEVFLMGTDPVNPDTDGDTRVDGADNCPSWSNAAQNLPNWPIPLHDADCDGFSTATEKAIGTDPTRQCPVGGTPDAWPPDHAISGSINILDVTALKSVFGQTVPPAPVRRDINLSGNINILDITILKAFFGQSCTP
jgi:hypothetical protein